MDATTTRQYLRMLNIFGLALFTGQTLFGLIMLLLHVTQPQAPVLDEQMSQIALLVAAGATLGGIVAGQVIFMKKVNVVRAKNDLGEKLQAYRSAVIVRYALWEGPSLVSLVLFYLTNDYLFFAPVVLILALFVINRPAKGSIVQHLQLHDNERMLLDDDNAVLY